MIHETQYWTVTNIADGLNALAICIEVSLAPSRRSGTHNLRVLRRLTFCARPDRNPDGVLLRVHAARVLVERVQGRGRPEARGVEGDLG